MYLYILHIHVLALSATEARIKRNTMSTMSTMMSIMSTANDCEVISIHFCTATRATSSLYYYLLSKKNPNASNKNLVSIHILILELLPISTSISCSMYGHHMIEQSMDQPRVRLSILLVVS